MFCRFPKWWWARHGQNLLQWNISRSLFRDVKDVLKSFRCFIICQHTAGLRPATFLFKKNRSLQTYEPVAVFIGWLNEWSNTFACCRGRPCAFLPCTEPNRSITKKYRAPSSGWNETQVVTCWQTRARAGKEGTTTNATRHRPLLVPPSSGSFFRFYFAIG